MENILCLCLMCLSFGIICRISLTDTDFEGITITRADLIELPIYMAAFGVIMMGLPFFAKMYASVALPVLLVSAYTDKKVKLLYNAVFYLLAPLALILETLQNSITVTEGIPTFSFHLSMQTLSVIIFAVILELLGMYGNGDKGMTIVCGCIWLLMYPDGGWAECLLADCIMLLVAEVSFYLRAVKEKNLNGPFKLKESRPLGPDLLLATTILLLGGTAR